MEKVPPDLIKCWQEFFGNTSLPANKHIYKKVMLQAKHYRDEVIKQFSVIEDHLLQNEYNQMKALQCVHNIAKKLQELLIQFHMVLECIEHTHRECIRLEHLIEYVIDWCWFIEDCIKIVVADWVYLHDKRNAPLEYYQTNILN